MNDYKHLREQFKIMFPDWKDEEVNKYAKFMSDKYSTIRRGDNIIHLEYYEGILIKDDIDEISSTIAQEGLELSRFDKNGMPYASAQDFMLHVSLILRDPVVGNLILGVSGGAMWDAIKASSILIWKKIKERHWSKNTKKENRIKPLNFGLHVSIDKNTEIDLKIDGGLSEESALKALDKVIDLIKSTKKNQKSPSASFFQTDSHGNWCKVDTNKEMRSQILKQNEKK